MNTGIATAVAYFGHRPEFGVVTSTVAGREDGIAARPRLSTSSDPAQQVAVTVPTERIYLIDVESGVRLR